MRISQVLHDKGFIHRRLFYRDTDKNQTRGTHLHLWLRNLLIDEHGEVRLISFGSGKKHEGERQQGRGDCPEVTLMQLYRHSKNPADFMKNLANDSTVNDYFSS